MSDLVEPFNEFLSQSPALGVATYPRLKNLELFLSSLAVPQPFLDEAQNAYNRGLFWESTRWLAEHMFAAQRHTLGSRIPGWLEAILRTWHERQSTVVTLNYDTLIESAVMTVDLDEPEAGRVMPQFTYANPVRFAASDWAGTYNPYEGRKPTFTLCKLHGSLSWWRSGSPQQAPVDVEVWKDTFNSNERASWEDIAGRVMLGEPMLVPPTASKTDYLDNDLVRANWRRAFAALSGATTVVIMGYSFPAGDMQMSALLGSATEINRGQHIIVVNPDLDVATRVADAALPRSGIVEPFTETSNPVAAWADAWAADPNGIYASVPPHE